MARASRYSGFCVIRGFGRRSNREAVYGSLGSNNRLCACIARADVPRRPRQRKRQASGNPGGFGTPGCALFQYYWQGQYPARIQGALRRETKTVMNILQYCLLKHAGRTSAQLGIFDDAPEPPLGAGVTVSVAADGRLAVRYRLGHSEALYRLQRPKDGKPQRKRREKKT